MGEPVDIYNFNNSISICDENRSISLYSKVMENRKFTIFNSVQFNMCGTNEVQYTCYTLFRSNKGGVCAV